MEDVLKRLVAVEATLSQLRAQVSGIAATLPYLATKAEVAELRAEVRKIAAVMPYLATKADLS
jgi:hypothetical protein